MMWNFGSGLSLYWACSNFIGVAQQMVMNRTSLGREIREIAIRRAQKKNGKIINARR
jgi:YidC/Oxa1 family membrane protein insertase